MDLKSDKMYAEGFTVHLDLQLEGWGAAPASRMGVWGVAGDPAFVARE